MEIEFLMEIEFEQNFIEFEFNFLLALNHILHKWFIKIQLNSITIFTSIESNPKVLLEILYWIQLDSINQKMQPHYFRVK